MRKLFMAGMVSALFALAVPVSAENINVLPKTFQVFGVIEDSEPQKASFRLSDLPDTLASQTISFRTSLAPGSILVKTGKRRLYYILPDGQAIEYKVGVGREGFTWSGTNKVSRKAEWPGWRPPPEMIKREAKRGRKLPEYMEGGPENPLGARAIYIGDTEFRIHGTSQPWSIGQAMSSGCIRMMNEEVIDLYDRVKVGATVVVEN